MLKVELGVVLNLQQSGESVQRQRRSRPKIVDEIIESLRQEIVSGRLANGTKLPTERDLANRFSVSQPTVREAIRSLETLGLVEVQHGSGTYVRGQSGYSMALALQTFLQLESVGVMEVIQVRQILGLKSVIASAEFATNEQIARMKSSLDKLDHVEDAKEVDEIIFEIIEFQRSISAACRNPLLHSFEVFLVTLLLEVQVKGLKKKGLKFWRARATEFHVDRHAVYEAIVAHCPEDAAKAMERYFTHQRSRFEEDASLRRLNFSDPKLIEAVADMVQNMKGA